MERSAKPAAVDGEKVNMYDLFLKRNAEKQGGNENRFFGGWCFLFALKLEGWWFFGALAKFDWVMVVTDGVVSSVNWLSAISAGT